MKSSRGYSALIPCWVRGLHGLQVLYAANHSITAGELRVNATDTRGMQMSTHTFTLRIWWISL